MDTRVALSLRPTAQGNQQALTRRECKVTFKPRFIWTSAVKTYRLDGSVGFRKISLPRHIYKPQAKVAYALDGWLSIFIKVVIFFPSIKADVVTDVEEDRLVTLVIPLVLHQHGHALQTLFSAVADNIRILRRIRRSSR